MRLQPSRRTLAAALAVLVVLSGCSAIENAVMGAATEAIQENADDAYVNASDYTADVTVTVESGGGTTTREGTVYAKPDENAHRVEWSSPSSLAGAVCIQQGDEVTVEGANVSRAAGESCYASGLPNYLSLASAFADDYNATITGAEEFGNRSTTVLELTPKDGADAPTGTVTVWLHAKTQIPLKQEVEVSTEDGGTKTVTIRLRNLEQGDVADSKFETDG
jgi:outer membrane lipoprotein-sorting protein